MYSLLRGMLNRRRWQFQWRYWRSKTPWDTGITPPEVVEFLSQTTAGRALDLGCGTGTNAISLAHHGWRVTGVDFPHPLGPGRPILSPGLMLMFTSWKSQACLRLYRNASSY